MPKKTHVQSLRIHVWNIYLHWDYLENYFRGQCRQIFQHHGSSGSGTQVDVGLPGARAGRTMRGACSRGRGKAEHWDPPGREQISLGAGEA